MAIGLIVLVLFWLASSTTTAASASYTQDQMLDKWQQQQQQRQQRRQVSEASSSSFSLIDGSYSLHFRQCLAMAAENPPWVAALMEQQQQGDMTDMINKLGQIQAQESIVVFDLCKDDNECQEYVIELNAFVASVANQPMDETIRYCTACQESMDFCFLDFDGNNNRQLRGTGTIETPLEYIECDQCQDWQCFEPQPSDRLEADRRVLVWMEDIVACRKLPESAITWNNNNNNEHSALYAGFMCNQDGTGAEVALFLDPLCSVYTSTVSFSDLMEGKHQSAMINVPPEPDQEASNVLDQQILNPAQHSSRLVTRPFLEPISCADVSFVNPDTAEPPSPPLHPSHHEQVWAMNGYCQGALAAGIALGSCDNKLPDDTEEPSPNFLLSSEQTNDLNQACSVIRQHHHDKDHPAHNDNDSLWHVYRETDGDFGSGSMYAYRQDDEGLSGPQRHKGDGHDGEGRILSNRLLELICGAIVMVVLAVSVRDMWRRGGPTSLLAPPPSPIPSPSSCCAKTPTRGTESDKVEP